mmetsp:Transcript_21929/g.40005  ORF Transcript_21929/g.40005 Transcript_21929/m.40005 type:complete len:349 (-) Transcript_21929:5572-6618(-)
MNPKADKKKQFDLAAKSIEWKRVLLLELSGLNYDRTLTQTSLKPQNPHVLESILKFLVSKLGFADVEYNEALEMLADWSKVYFKPDTSAIEDIAGWTNFLCFAVWAAQLAKPEDLPANEWAKLSSIDKYLKGSSKPQRLQEDDETLQMRVETEMMQEIIREHELPSNAEVELEEYNDHIKCLEKDLSEAEGRRDQQKGKLVADQNRTLKEMSSVFANVCNAFGVSPDPSTFDNNASSKLAQACTAQADINYLIEMQKNALEKAKVEAKEAQANKSKQVEELKKSLAITQKENEELKKTLHSVEEMVSNCQFEKDELEAEISAKSFRVLELLGSDLMVLETMLDNTTKP